MENPRLAKLSFEQAQELSNSDIIIIENFIASNTSEIQKVLSFDYPFSFDGLTLGICLKGSINMKIDYKDYEISENTVCTILPNQIVETIDRTDDLFIEILNFSMDFLIDFPFPKNYDIFNKVKEVPCLQTSKDNIQYLINYHNLIVTAFNREKHLYSNEAVKGLLYVLIAEIVGMYIQAENKDALDTKNTRGEEITEKFMKLLLEHHKQERSTTFYSDKLCMSTKYLSSVLKKVTNRSINSWIYDAVITSAKILLKSSNLTVLQVSEELNFPNPSFFGKFFKQNTGLTPLEYRNKE